MYLKELDLGNKVKCNCHYCEGTGIYKGIAEREDLGVVCKACNGKGYYILNTNEVIQLVKDEERNVVYVMEDGIIYDTVELFMGLKPRDDVNYVMYGTGKVFSPNYLFEHGATEVEVIKYQDFLEGKMPLPITKYSCPGQLTQSYGHNTFDNDCHITFFPDCEEFGKQSCWKKFYGEANTIEEKQALLKRVLK